jgi:nucleotide-binding universal stress UspA family protein
VRYSQLTLVHALEDTSKLNWAEEAAKADEDLKKLVRVEVRKNLRAATAVRIGRDDKEIIQVASENDADLVVMAVRGRNALDLAVFGSTTYRVIHLGRRPVLAVRL